MTLVSAWSDSKGDLLVASDSHLNGGGDWDCCPKIFPMPRGDSVLAFAGTTAWAYPILLQILRWADDFEPARDRVYPLEKMRRHVEKQINLLFARIRGAVFPPQAETEIMLAGFSAEKGAARVYRTKYNKGTKQVDLVEEATGGGSVLFMGDASKEARKRLNATFHTQRSRRKTRVHELGLEECSATSAPVDLGWAPLTIIRDIARDQDFPTVGGAPQIVRVSRHLNVMAYGVFWPSRTHGEITLLGRPLLGYEQTRRIVLDIDEMSLYQTWRYLPTPTPFKPPHVSEDDEREPPVDV